MPTCLDARPPTRWCARTHADKPGRLLAHAPPCSWYVLHGRWLFPDPAIPALAHYALTPLWWAYKLAGPQLAWRLNRLPAIANRAYVVANTLVWGPVLLVALVLWAVWRSSGRASVGSRRASRPALFRAHTRPFSVPMGAARR